MIRPCVLACCLWVGLAAVGDVRARADDGAAESERNLANRAMAQALFDEGLRLFKAGEYEAACEKLQGSLSLHPDGLGTHGKLAECFEKLGRKASAWAVYRKLASLAERLGDTRRRDIARERAQRLDSEVARLSIDMAASDRPAGLQIWRNRTPVAVVALGTPVAVDAGRQRIVAWAEGYAAHTVEIEVADGQVETVTIPALRKVRTARRLAGWGVLGAGAISVGVGLFFGARAISLQNEAFEMDLCDEDNNCSAAGRDLLVEANGRANLANLFVGLGVGAAAVGVYLWLTAPTSRAPDMVKGKLSVVPLVTGDQRGLAVIRRF